MLNFENIMLGIGDGRVEFREIAGAANMVRLVVNKAVHIRKVVSNIISM